MTQDNLIYKERNLLLFDEQLQIMSSLLKNYNPTIPIESEYYAVIFELRSLERIKTIIKNHLFFLNQNKKNIKWGLQIFHGNQNESFIKKELSEFSNIVYENLNIDNVDKYGYSSLLKKLEFWERVKGKKVLLFQSDSMLLRPGIDEYLKYDYVGAPWTKPKEGKFVGNGGLSLRTKDRMIDIIKEHSSEDDMIEDIFFSKYVNDDQVPNIEIAKKFSVEDVYYPDPMGIHNPIKIPTSLLKDIFDNNIYKFTI
jgi:hypothetical protein